MRRPSGLPLAIAAFTFSLNPVFAGSDPAPEKNLNPSGLNPAVPALATFDESVPDQDLTYKTMLKVLAPTTPEVADFYETTDDLMPAANDFEPSVPVSADFNDTI